MSACVYCGEDAGDYDEHEACVEASIAADADADDAETADRV